MITWSPEEVIYSDACLVFVVTGIFCAAVRWFHMCRPFDKEAYYFYPARWQVSFFFAAVVMELPYVFAPSSSAVWNYIRIFGILYCPMCLSSIFLRYFRQRGLDEWGDRLFVGVPMLMLLVLMTLAVAGSSLLAESSAILMLAVVLCSVVLLGRMILVTVWVKRRIYEYIFRTTPTKRTSHISLLPRSCGFLWYGSLYSGWSSCPTAVMSRLSLMS